jgi:hypothetical protein
MPESDMQYLMRRAKILSRCDYSCSACEQQFGQQRVVVGVNSDRLFCKTRGEIVDVVGT